MAWIPAPALMPDWIPEPQLNAVSLMPWTAARLFRNKCYNLSIEKLIGFLSQLNAEDVDAPLHRCDPRIQWRLGVCNDLRGRAQATTSHLSVIGRNPTPWTLNLKPE
jgi:hypothetical protein